MKDEEHTSKRRRKNWKECNKRLQCCSRGEEMLYSKRLNELNLLILPKRILSDDLIKVPSQGEMLVTEHLWFF